MMPMPNLGWRIWEFSYEVSFEQVRPLIGMGQVIQKLVPGAWGWRRWQSRFRRQRTSRYGPNYFQPMVRGNWYSICNRLDCGWLLLARLLLKKWKFCSKLQVDDLLDEITTSSDAEASKPSPDIVEAALSKLNTAWPSFDAWWHTYDIKLPVRLESVWLLYAAAAWCGSSGSQGDLRWSCWLLAHYADSPLGKTA